MFTSISACVGDLHATTGPLKIGPLGPLTVAVNGPPGLLTAPWMVPLCHRWSLT